VVEEVGEHRSGNGESLASGEWGCGGLHALDTC
jgi:hypothetical protein